MLQMYPKLDAATAKQILHDTARRDSFTGAVPNPTWGYGKIDACAALERLLATILRINAVERVGADIRLTVSAAAGRNYRVEYSDNLESGSWQPLASAQDFPGNAAPIQFIDPSAASLPKRFYRAALAP